MDGRRQSLTLRKHFVHDVRRADLRQKIMQLKKPLLVMHSPTDTTVGIENASDIFNTPHPRSFVALEGSDHLLTKRARPSAPPGSSRRGRINT